MTKDITPQHMRCGPFNCPAIFTEGAAYLIIGKKVENIPDELQSRIGPDELLIAVPKRLIDDIESGDCGNWDVDAEPEVAAARADAVTPAQLNALMEWVRAQTEYEIELRAGGGDMDGAYRRMEAFGRADLFGSFGFLHGGNGRAAPKSPVDV